MENSKQIDDERFIFHLIVQLALATLGGLTFGYNLGNINSLNDLLAIPWRISLVEKEMSTGSLVIGGMIGSAMSGAVADRFGRRLTIVGLSILGCCLTVILSLSFHIMIFIICRALLGIVVGATGTAIPMLLSEIATSKTRGWITGAFQVAITLGILFGYLFGWMFSYLQVWEPIILIGSIPFSCIVIMWYWIPESPHWRQMREAKNHDSDEDDVDSKKDVGWIEIVTVWRTVFVIGLILAIGQALTGINSIIFYSKDIFRMSGLGENQFELQVAVGVWNTLTSIFALPFIDWVGRRPLMIIGFAGLTVANFIVAFSFFFKVGMVGALGVFVFIAFFELGPGPLFFVIISEIYPVRIKGKMMALCNFLQWACNLIVSLSFLTISSDPLTTGLTFFAFGMIALVATTSLFYILPESKGQDLNVLHESLSSDKSIYKRTSVDIANDLSTLVEGIV